MENHSIVATYSYAASKIDALAAFLALFSRHSKILNQDPKPLGVEAMTAACAPMLSCSASI